MTGKQLKSLRLDKGITKHKLSSKLGINIRTLNRWEHENQNIHRKYYARIQCIFDLDFFEVITRTYRTEEEKETLRKQRVEIMGRMDRKAEKWSDLPEDDADLIAFRKVVGA